MHSTLKIFAVLGFTSLAVFACQPANQFAGIDIPESVYGEGDIKQLTFKAGEIRTESIEFEARPLSFKEDIVMEQKPNRFAMTNQIVRPTVEETITQGGKGRDQNETFNVFESGYLDLLIIIDNSSSMEMFQDLLKQRFQNLMRNLSSTNWKIAVATTTSSCLRSTANGAKFLTKADYEQFPDLVRDRFDSLISAGSSGSTVEKGILSAADALIGDCGDPAFSWIRPDSQKAVLIVTDEKNCGSASNEGCADKPYAKAEYFLERAPKNTRVYGLLLFEDDYVNCPNSGGYDNQYPIEYMRLIQKTKGLSAEICQADYSMVLDTISSHVSQYVKRKFELMFKPDPGSLKIYLGNQLITEGFVLVGNELRLMMTPPSDSNQLMVEYTYGKQSVRRYFDLWRPIDEKTLKVSVNGKASQIGYRVVEEKTVVFDKPPLVDAKLDFKYKEMGKLNSTFSIKWPETAYPHRVYVDGIETTAQINLQDQTLFFDDPPKDGAEITLEYQDADAKMLNYPLPYYESREIKKLEILDPSTGESVPFSIEDDTISFPPDQVWAGRELISQVSFVPKESDGVFKITLPDNLVEDSLNFGSNIDEECQQGMQLNQNQLVVSCMKLAETGFSFSYKYIEGYTNEFKVVDEDDSRNIWRVYINGEPVKEFMREDGYLILDSAILEPTSTVSVEVIPPAKP